MIVLHKDNNIRKIVYKGYPNQHITDWINEYSLITSPIYFEVLTNGTIKLEEHNSGSPYEISLLYSFDNKNWNDWDYATGTNVVAGQKFYVKAKTENNGFGSYDSFDNLNKFTCFSITCQCNICGNIMSLLYNDFVGKRTLNIEYCLAFIFFKIDKIIDASKLLLPAKTLSEYCYHLMFYGCTKLVYPPKKLQAKNLVKGCYKYMFRWCIYLSSAPQLQAIILAEDCYIDIFYYCTKIPELHYPKSIVNDKTFTSMSGYPWFGATNATVYYDL